jgi:hypothetical protein
MSKTAAKFTGKKTPTSIVPIYFKGVIFHVQIQILLVPFITIPSI